MKPRFTNRGIRVSTVELVNLQDELRREKAKERREADKEARYGPVVGNFASKSDPSKGYQVRRSPATGLLTCNCKGWIFNKTCDHTKQVAKDILSMDDLYTGMRGAVATQEETEADASIERARRMRFLENRAAGQNTQRFTAREADVAYGNYPPMPRFKKPAVTDNERAPALDPFERAIRNAIEEVRGVLWAPALVRQIANRLRPFLGAAAAPAEKPADKPAVRQYILDD